MIGDLPDSDLYENFNDEEAVNYVKSIVSLLSFRENIENEKVLKDLTSRLCNSYFDYQDFLDKISDTLVISNFCERAFDIFTFTVQSNQFQSDFFSNLLNALINYSECSLSFAKSISSSNIMKSLTKFCIDNQDSSFLNNVEQNKLISRMLNIILNVVRSPVNIIVDQNSVFKATILKFINHNDADKLGLFSILILSYMIQENEVSLLDKGVNVIGILLNKIKNVNPVDRRCNGFSVRELLNSLRSLSSNDNIKTKIVSENGLLLFFKILEEDNDEIEKELVLKILWNLCFNPSIKETLKTAYNLKNVILQFNESSNSAIKEDCYGITWLLDDKDKRNESNESSKFDQSIYFDVFISYSREYKDTISKIKNRIIESNLRVWIDDEQMFGSTIEAMATGIEKSRVFIIAMSKAYTESPNCRCEAEYAFKLRKPIVPVVLQLKFKPISWLGFIIGTKMYYEFSERRDSQETMTGIIKSIRFIMDGNQESEEIIEEKRHTLTESSMKITEVNERIRKWSKSDVSQWLIGSNLGNLQKSFKELDGSLLEVLIGVNNRSPEYFNYTLKKEFGMKFIDVLRFHKALQSLQDAS